MFETYDTEQKAYVEHVGEYYDTEQKAWVEVPSAMTYDTEERAWVERLRKYMETSVGSGFYNNTGNIVLISDGLFHCEVKPSYVTYDIEFTLKKDFTNPLIEYEYSFGNSDLCPSIASGFRSHACIEWIIRGYRNGEMVASKYLAHGSNYAYATIFDEPASVKMEGTFDEIRLVCSVNSLSGYANYGKANTSIENFSIDGKKYSAKAQAITS